MLLYFGANTKKQRTVDSINIINYIYKNFEYIDISNYIYENFNIYQKTFSQNINLYKTKTKPEIILEKIDNYKFPLKKNNINSLDCKFYSVSTLSSKFNSHDIIGCMNIYYENQILTSINIFLNNTLIKNNCIHYFFKTLSEFQYSF